MELTGRVIKRGFAQGIALVSSTPVGFLGGIEPETGIVLEPGHPLEGQSVAGRVLVFPTGKGSTVGSYILYRLKKNGAAPVGMVNSETEPIVAVGAIISDIPMVDGVEMGAIASGDWVKIRVEEIRIN